MNISYYGIRPNISQAYISYAFQSTAHKLLQLSLLFIPTQHSQGITQQSLSTRSKDYCQAITIHTHDTEYLNKRTVFLYTYSTAINLTKSGHHVTDCHQSCSHHGRVSQLPQAGGRHHKQYLDKIHRPQVNTDIFCRQLKKQCVYIQGREN